jgi:hypothetical protein
MQGMRTWILAPLLTVFAADAYAGMRCDSRVISAGRSTFEVRSLCGEPVNVEVGTETRVIRRRLPNKTFAEHRITVAVERWTYVPGPDQLIRSLVFENGKLASITTEGRPPSGEPTPEQCQSSVHSTGDTTTEVLLQCGPPADVQRWYEEHAIGNRRAQRWVSVPYERWTYNFGPHRFLRILTFEGGRLIRQETAGKGF